MAEKRKPMDLAKTPKPHVSQKKGRDPKRPVGWYCAGHNRDGDPCTNRAGKGTDHLGQGKCKSHGGATPLKHGRYSTITRPRIAELLNQFEDDPDPLNILPEVKLLRALIIDYIERYDAFTDALLSWYDSWKKDGVNEGRPRQVIDILTVGKFIADIGSLVEKIQKQRQEGTISMATLNRVMEMMAIEVASAVQEVVKDADQSAKLLGIIENRWSTISLDNPRPGTERSP